MCLSSVAVYGEYGDEGYELHDMLPSLELRWLSRYVSGGASEVAAA